ncbi:gamma carbonic anhydrase family protein [Deltaproteobacteria bacterium]|nr:gamma carbonic anhydrase family protein [Deltaproteobacteria bacterium]
MLYRFEGKQPVIGKETYVSELAHVIGDVTIGDNCYVGHGTVLRGDYGRIEIKDGTAVEEGVIIHAPPGETCFIGLKVTIGHGAIIHSRNIGDLVVIGMGAVLSIRSEIGNRSIIAEGGVVKQNQVISSKVVASGNPVKIVRNITRKDEEYWDWGKQLYIDLAKRYIKSGIEPVDG